MSALDIDTAQDAAPFNTVVMETVLELWRIVSAFSREQLQAVRCVASAGA
jgi:hypothetical protein